MKIIHTELKNYNRRADESVSFRLDSLLELSSEDIAEIDSHRGDITVLVLTDTIPSNDIPEINIDEILQNLPENDLYDNYKSPSKRFRGVLWHYYKQKIGREPTNEEFVDYYKKTYEKLISRYKEKLDDV